VATTREGRREALGGVRRHFYVFGIAKKLQKEQLEKKKSSSFQENISSVFIVIKIKLSSPSLCLTSVE
jgi:hypothetical protein